MSYSGNPAGPSARLYEALVRLFPELEAGVEIPESDQIPPQPLGAQTAAPDLDTQQVELIGRALLEGILIRERFEVARPARDQGVDLVVYLVNPFRSLPIQVKVKTGEGFDVHKKYARHTEIILAYVWNIHEVARFFLLTFEESLEVLGDVALSTASWQENGYYNTSRPSREMRQRLERFENRWEWLRGRLSSTPLTQLH